MSMSTGGGGKGPQADINMTPLIDVLLVLLIIFMVITRSRQRVWTHWFRNLLRRTRLHLPLIRIAPW